ncbi:MAG: DNA repair protein RecN [candidate division KSB1 bacterium]|nr:DNA repair protein RecN [candidate division KSB1 bacterium]
MLTRLRVQNFAVIDQIEVTFEPGLNVITGETGAGKSILIDALGTVLGERADATILRAGEERAVVEAEFLLPESSPVRSVLAENELLHPEQPDYLVLRREIFASGRSRAFANDSPVALPLLQEVGNLLVDLHGQHEHQTLLRPSTHILFLDEFAGLGKLVEQFGSLYREHLSLARELRELSERERLQQEKRELMEFQLKEIEAVQPSVEEEEELLLQEKILSNSQRLFEGTSLAYDLLYEQEGSVVAVLARAIAELISLASIDPSFQRLAEELEQARVTAREVANTLQSYRERIDSDPVRLEEVRQRLASYARLKKRYGLTVQDVLRHRDHLRRELEEVSSLRNQIENRQAQLDNVRAQMTSLATELSHARREAARRLEEAVVRELAELGMPRAEFRVSFGREEDPAGVVEIEGVRYRTTPRGIDQVEFFLSTNPGQGLRPLTKVASGGEVSRVMLALKSVLAHCDPVPTLVFDEIDMGISGRIAQVVGSKLGRLARERQVLCITHLPQIASHGRSHFLVEKVVDAHTTRTQVRRLSEKEREEAIARLLSGEKVEESHLEAARALIQEARRSQDTLA